MSLTYKKVVSSRGSAQTRYRHSGRSPSQPCPPQRGKRIHYTIPDPFFINVLPVRNGGPVSAVSVINSRGTGGHSGPVLLISRNGILTPLQRLFYRCEFKQLFCFFQYYRLCRTDKSADPFSFHFLNNKHRRISGQTEAGTASGMDPVHNYSSANSRRTSSESVCFFLGIRAFRYTV